MFRYYRLMSIAIAVLFGAFAFFGLGTMPAFAATSQTPTTQTTTAPPSHLTATPIPGHGPGNPGTSNPGPGNPGTSNPGPGNPGPGNPGSGDQNHNNHGPNNQDHKSNPDNNNRCYPTISKGAHGDEVTTLRTDLRQQGYKGEDGHLLAVKSYFDDNTVSAVKHFQRDNNLTADGVVGPSTWRALGECHQH